jgi:hypothetical protein
VKKNQDYRSKRDFDILNYKKSKIENFYAGMFTNIVNTMYIPETLLKPTDFNSNIRNAFIQVMDKYYGNICQILPHNQVLKLNSSKDKWNISNFPPPVIVGNKDYVDDFIKYRESVYMKFE